MSESEQVKTEEVKSEEKSTRSPQQLEILARARVKAAEVRAKNKDLRDKQREIDRIAVEQTKREN